MVDDDDSRDVVNSDASWRVCDQFVRLAERRSPHTMSEAPRFFAFVSKSADRLTSRQIVFISCRITDAKQTIQDIVMKLPVHAIHSARCF